MKDAGAAGCLVVLLALYGCAEPELPLEADPSAEAEPAPVEEPPDVVGLNLRDARAALEAAGFEVGETTRELAEDPHGQVIAQASGTGGTVNLTVASRATLTGTMVLEDGFELDGDDRCSGTGGYSDVREGAQLTVSDESGTVLGVAEFSPGNVDPYDVGDESFCQFAFVAAGLPRADFYVFELGRRGDLTYSLGDMERMNWRLNLHLD